MHPEDLMKPDLFSEIVLMGSGGLLFASLILIVVIAFTRVWRRPAVSWGGCYANDSSRLRPYSGNWCLNKATPENRPLTRGTRQVLTHFLASTTLAALTKGRPQEF